MPTEPVRRVEYDPTSNSEIAAVLRLVPSMLLGDKSCQLIKKGNQITDIVCEGECHVRVGEIAKKCNTRITTENGRTVIHCFCGEHDQIP